MSKISLSPSASGTGNFTIASPNSNTDRTLTLPDATGTINTSGAVNEVPAGTASAPSIFPTGDTNTGIFFPAADTIGFTEGGAEAMRIDSSGKLLVGTTSLYNSSANIGTFSWSSATANGGEGGYAFVNTSTSTSSDANPCLILHKSSTTTTSSQRFVQFYANGTTQPMGGIVGNGATNAQFISLSDIRDKENIQPIVNSLDKIISLNPVEFDWKFNGEHVNAGFIAQEVENVFPEYVVDNISNEGQEERKGLTGGMTGGIIPHLVKAIQEQQTIIETLKADIAELKAKVNV